MEQYDILYEDDDILVANKFAPISVQKDKSGDPSLQELIAAARSLARLEAAHRIDRRTSGIVLFAKTAAALAALDAAFRDHEIRKHYVACVEREPSPEAGRLEHLIVFDRRTNHSRAIPAASATTAAPGDAAPAALDYRLACRSERYFFLDVTPETGRHHQIRAQLAAAGWPIRGDLKYGARRSCKSGRIMLHARGIEFRHPRSGETLSYEAPFPADEPLWTAYRPESERPQAG